MLSSIFPRSACGASALTLALVLVSSFAAANPAANAEAPAKPAKANPKAADPYILKLREGDSAYLARDYANAASIYSDAIKAQPQNALGHFRLGEALRAQGQLDAALEAFGNASRFAATLADRQRASFLIADTHERAAKLPQAKSDWLAYQTAATEHAKRLAAKTPGVSADDPVYPESAVERLKQVDATVERTEAYAAVKQRIAAREAEISAKARADAAKSK